MRNRNTLEYLGLWEMLNNPDFNPLEFEGFRNQYSKVIIRKFKHDYKDCGKERKMPKNLYTYTNSNGKSSNLVCEFACDVQI